MDGAEILSQLVERNTFFALDIGTKCDDLLKRHVQFQETFAKMQPGIRDEASEMIYYSAGIWPDVEEIKNRFDLKIQSKHLWINLILSQ